MAIFLNSPERNIVTQLIDPHLGSCKRYRRLVAFFRPSVLKVWKNSLDYIINNDDVRIEMIIAGTHENNLKLLEELNRYNSDAERSEVLNRRANEILEEASGLSGYGGKERQRNILAWLIKQGKLEFKLSFVCHDASYQLDHRKIGYFEKHDGQKIVFEGSVNESDSAYVRHGESLWIWDSNEDSDLPYIQDLAPTLDSLWDEAPSDIYKIRKPNQEFLEKVARVCTIRDKFQANEELTALLQEYAEEEQEEQGSIEEVEEQLWPHQENAIDEWFSGGCRGIIEHATGTGKTFTAQHILKRQYDETGSIAVIGVPFIALAEQWSDGLNDFLNKKNLENFKIIECWSNSNDRNWSVAARSALIDRNINPEKPLLIFIVVNNSLEKFHELYFTNEFDVNNCLFIGDECHRYTSATYLNYLPDCNYRLGLSATPFVDLEELRDGEIKMKEYFEGTHNIFTLEDAINSDPKYLCDYSYFPIPCYLEDEEYEAWKELYIKSGWVSNENEYDVNTRGSIFGQMSDILGSASDKLSQLALKLKENESDKKYSLIFAGQGKDSEDETDIRKIAKVLEKRNWSASKITAEVDRSNRKEIINMFRNGVIDTILAIKILDEGIDIPEIKNAYILASSANRRQFVQRRGRVLRLLKGKEKHAKIYDFIVIPPNDNENAAKKIIANECKRIDEMSQSAKNIEESRKFIKEHFNKE